ncbi:DUF397 domain-containing protein [Streptomyces sp. NPDC005573]|uniref:DUF397 domain-containing protein n=1 Tax=Streptomyces sp. NPDC005573 TaxID=3156890 RepID=UPI0033BC97A3
MRSSHSGGGGGECVEAFLGEERVLVRDSKRPGGDRVLVFCREAWCGFLTELVEPGAGGS